MTFKKEVRKDPTYLSKDITGYETRVYRYESETWQQSSQWESPSSPCLKTAAEVCSQVKNN
jgi:hypothetical protein